MNDKVIKAMAVGLSAVMSLSTPMTVMAAEGDDVKEPEVVPTSETDTTSKSNQAAESAIQEAKDSTTDAAKITIDEKNQTQTTDGTAVTTTPNAAEAAQAEVLEDVSIEKTTEAEAVVDENAEEKKEENTVIDYDGVTDNEKAANGALLRAEADLIKEDASEQAAAVAVNSANTILDEVDANNIEISASNEAAKAAAEKADAAAEKANNATTEAEVEAAIEEIEAVQAELEKEKADAQANYDENTAKLAEAKAKLAEAEAKLAEAQASLTASEKDIAEAQAAVDQAEADAKALKAAVDADAEALQASKEAALKAAYDKMMAKKGLITKFYTGDAAKGDGIDDEYVDSFGKETAKAPGSDAEDKSTYWSAADEYFELYLQFVYGDAYAGGKWDRTNRYYTDEGETKNHAERDNTFIVTYYVLDEAGNKVVDEEGNFVTETALYNYHTDENNEGNISIYEKKVCKEEVTQSYEETTVEEDVLSIKTETVDATTGETVVTYTRYEEKDGNQVCNIEDENGNETGSILVKDASSTMTAEVNDLENYKNSLEGTNKEVVGEATEMETTYSIGKVTVIDSYEKKDEYDKTYEDFDTKKDIENTVQNALNNGQTVKIVWRGILDDYDMEVKDASGFVLFVDKLAGIVGKGIKVITYNQVDDYERPITHEEDGIIETTTADVTVKEVKTESVSVSDFEDTWGWVWHTGLFGVKYKTWEKIETAEEKATAATQARVAQINDDNSNSNANASCVPMYFWGVLVGYEIVYDTYTTSTQTVSTKSYTATQYDKNTITTTTTKTKTVTNDWLEERKNTTNDQAVKDAISGYEAALTSMKNKQDAAAIALAAAKQAQADVAAAKEALKNESLDVNKDAYNTALKNYNDALTAQKESEEKLKEIKNAVIQAEKDFADAEEELARFIPIPVEDDDDDDDDDAAAGDFADAAVVTPVVTTIMPDAVPLAATPAAGGAAVADAADAADDVDAEGDDEDENGGVVIEDNETPLAGDIEETLDAEEVTIEDAETPLAAAPIEKMSWWWLLIVALLGATGYEMYRKHQAKKAQVTDTDK